MRKYYPVGLQIEGRRCLVVGGGKVAQRKVARLIAFGAKVKVVSPGITRRLRTWAGEGRILVQKRKFTPGAMRGADLIFAATNDPRINGRIAKASKRKGIWVNVANPGKDSSFILPALIEKKGLTVSVSTHGKSPGLAKKIKKKLKKVL